MKELAELREIWIKAEQDYRTAKTSLDNSLEYILAREKLSQARFNFDKACRRHVLITVFNEVDESICI